MSECWPQVRWAFWDPSSPTGLVKEGYQVKFRVSTISTQPPWAGGHSSVCNSAWNIVGTVLVELVDIPNMYRQGHWLLAVT